MRNQLLQLCHVLREIAANKWAPRSFRLPHCCDLLNRVLDTFSGQLPVGSCLCARYSIDCQPREPKNDTNNNNKQSGISICHNYVCQSGSQKCSQHFSAEDTPADSRNLMHFIKQKTKKKFNRNIRKTEIITLLSTTHWPRATKCWRVFRFPFRPWTQRAKNQKTEKQTNPYQKFPTIPIPTWHAYLIRDGQVSSTMQPASVST